MFRFFLNISHRITTSHHQSPAANNIGTSFVADPPCHGVGCRAIVLSSTTKTVGATPGGGGGEGGGRGGEDGEGDAVDQEDLVLQRTLHTVRQRIKHYRMHLKPSFQVMRREINTWHCVLTRACVCVCVFTKLHITAQSGPVIYSLYATACNPPVGYLS